MAQKRYPEKIKHLPRTFQILIKSFVKRLDSGKNCLVAIVGGTGSGKSFASVCIIYWCSIYMHGELPSLEDSENHWFFNAQAFLKRMNDPDLKKRELNLWDEMGVSASHKDHQSTQNKAISWLVQTFRNLEQLVIFTVPTLAFVDKSVRNLLHYQLETRKILTTEKICIIKPLEIQYNIRMDKVYYHNLFWKAEDGSGFMEEVDVIGVPLPPPEFVDAYEKKSWAFKGELNKKIQAMIQKAEEKEKKSTLVGEEAIVAGLTFRQRKIWNILKEGVVDPKVILEKHGISPSTVYGAKKSFILKGLDLDYYIEKANSKIEVQEITEKPPRPKLTRQGGGEITTITEEQGDNSDRFKRMALEL